MKIIERKTHARVISSLDCLLLRIEREQRQQGSERLLVGDLHVGRGVRDDGGLEEVPVV